MSGWIGVDLDGTLAHYEGWKGKEHIGDPIPTMVKRVIGWISEGRHVKIFTARVSDGDPEVKKHIEKWCLQHIGWELDITCVKDYGMIELWDDRAVQVRLNSGEPVGYSTRGLD